MNVGRRLAGNLVWRARNVRERWLRRRLASTKLLRAFAKQYPQAFLIEIGANDGIANDPIREFVTANA